MNYPKCKYDDNRWTDEELCLQINKYRPIVRRYIRLSGRDDYTKDFGIAGGLIPGSRFTNTEGLMLRIRRGYFKNAETLKVAVKQALVEGASNDWYYTYQKDYGD